MDAIWGGKNGPVSSSPEMAPWPVFLAAWYLEQNKLYYAGAFIIDGAEIQTFDTAPSLFSQFPLW